MGPNLNEEKKLWRKGYKVVVGVDEVGRGPLAGPVVAAAVVILNPKHFGCLNFKNWNLFGNCPSVLSSGSKEKLVIGNLKTIRDSKKLSPSKRERFYEIITRHPDIEWGIGMVSNRVIDKINILQATKLAMAKAVRGLLRKFHDRENSVRGGFLILDGNFRIDLPLPQKPIVKGDEKVFSVAAASIIAKVWRDRLMRKYHQKYPRYRFDLHKGYPTKLHVGFLAKYGPCEIHRMSFEPVAQAQKVKRKA